MDSPAPAKSAKIQSTLTVLQANMLVAMLGGFWARKTDGHPGPDLLARGLIILRALVEWERTKKHPLRQKASAKEACRKPG
jgi:hypothetical protein